MSSHAGPASVSFVPVRATAGIDLERNCQFGRAGHQLNDLLFDCGDLRDGIGYTDVSGSAAPHVRAARARFEKILKQLMMKDLKVET